MNNTTPFPQSEILFNPSLPVVYTHIRTLATELAVLGKIEAASELISLLLQSHDTEREFANVKPLEPAFEYTGLWPDILAHRPRSRELAPRDPPPPPPPKDESEYEDLMSTERDPARCLAMAVALCAEARTGDLDAVVRDERVRRALGMVGERFHACVAGVAGYGGLWPVLARGVLARQVGVDEGKLEGVAGEVVRTVRMRLEEGRRGSEYAGMTVRELLEELDANTKKYARESGKEISGSCLRAPATEAAIRALEKKLDVPALPEDYREFLLASNGLESVFDGRGMTPPFHAAEDVVLSKHPGIFEHPLVLVSESSGTDELIRQFGSDAWPQVSTQLEIACEYERVFLLTAPVDVKPTVEAYKAALESENVSDAWKAETRQAIVDLYGSLEAFEKLEWAMIYDINFDPTIPVGTLRDWLEETVRKSSEGMDGSSGEMCLAYGCK